MKWANYKPSHRGVRELGLDDGMKKAVGRGAGSLLAVLRESDPRGDYRVQGAGAYVGRRREARHAAIVRGNWFPGATTAAMKRAIAVLAGTQQQDDRVTYTRVDGKKIRVTAAQAAHYSSLRGR